MKEFDARWASALCIRRGYNDETPGPIRRVGGTAKRGFSLLELLVSLTVLLVLIGIMLPALHRAVAFSAPLLRCSNHLAQINVALRLYLNDSMDAMPMAEYRPARGGPNGYPKPLNKTFAAYGAGDKALWRCPADDRLPAIVRLFGSYVYPPRKLMDSNEASSRRVFFDTLHLKFPIVVDSRPFHRKNGTGEVNSGRPMLPGTFNEPAPSMWNIGYGYNRLLVNGKISHIDPSQDAVKHNEN